MNEKVETMLLNKQVTQDSGGIAIGQIKFKWSCLVREMGWNDTVNFFKCKFLHLGNKNQMHRCEQKDSKFGKSTCEKDIGIAFVCKLKMTQQCDLTEKRQMQFWAAWTKIQFPIHRN